MKTGGIDIGSRFIKYVLLENNEIIEILKEDTGYNPLSICNKFIEDTKPDSIIATGYGRFLLELHKDIKTITEIKAVAIGAKRLFPSCGTIIDIGGQDTKVISINNEGNVISFEMNDRCAAGTGKFLEIMARTLGYEMNDFGNNCIEGEKTLKINSLCTVFAESEVISLISKGVDRRNIAYAIHTSIANKISPLINRVGIKEDIIFTGGCARNDCLRNLLKNHLRTEILVYHNPDIIAALGAAIYGMQNQ